MGRQAPKQAGKRTMIGSDEGGMGTFRLRSDQAAIVIGAV
jgi:hypothetical protein